MGRKYYTDLINTDEQALYDFQIAAILERHRTSNACFDETLLKMLSCRKRPSLTWSLEVFCLAAIKWISFC
jgi:hypothetical protein